MIYDQYQIKAVLNSLKRTTKIPEFSKQKFLKNAERRLKRVLETCKSKNNTRLMGDAMQLRITEALKMILQTSSHNDPKIEKFLKKCV